jgi:uncharacterized membrane protein
MGNQSSIYNILVFRFQGKDGADHALTEVKKKRKELGYKILDGAVMRSDEKGKASFHETADLSASQGAGVGALAGAVLGLLGGPAGVLVATAAGAITGGAVAHFTDQALPNDQLKQIAQSLSPDTSAIVLLVEDRETEKAMDSIEGLNAQVMTFTLGDEVSGDIAMGVAGEITFDEPGDAQGQETQEA